MLLIALFGIRDQLLEPGILPKPFQIRVSVELPQQHRWRRMEQRQGFRALVQRLISKDCHPEYSGIVRRQAQSLHDITFSVFPLTQAGRKIADKRPGIAIAGVLLQSTVGEILACTVCRGGFCKTI
ncbi:MAG: hypothetical protein DMG67_06335 [Acidobacteria bacterium]|nr:MAG: hypothetical protein DMG67_06335 [Acidobacteriota bacterium]